MARSSLHHLYQVTLCTREHNLTGRTLNIVTGIFDGIEGEEGVKRVEYAGESLR
jgi:hypothetical protein